MDKRRYVAFDLGAESGRAVIGSFDKGLLNCKEVYRFPNKSTAMGGQLYWNMIGIYDHLLEGLKTCTKLVGQGINGIGVDSWGVDYCLIDAQGNMAGNAFNYRDPRTTGTPEIIENTLGSEQLYEKTGVQMLPFNTLNQLIAAVRAEDPTLEIADRLLFIADFFHYCFTGKKVAEFTAVSISQLYNNGTGQWDDAIFNAFGIRRKIAPEVVQAGTVIGDLKPEIARLVGLDRTKVIAPAVHDTASAAVCIPTIEVGGWAFLSSGTWSIVGLELDAPIMDEKSMAMNISNSGGVLGKTLYLKNVMGLWILQQCKRIWNKKSPVLDYSDIVNRAFKATPFSALIDPDDLRFLNAEDMVAEVISFCKKSGQKVPEYDDIGTISRIIFESLALKYRFVLEQLMEGAGKEVETIYLIGGGGKNELLTQFTANATGRKVITGPSEASSVGNIMMQAVGDGMISSLGEVRTIIMNSFGVREYTPHYPKEWQTIYDRFISLIYK
ncbi:MAG: rhamnulokinase [Bacteroidetes bacterium]|nr:MAG: rhamnulokinase [Bacteroidota bacterium]